MTRRRFNASVIATAVPLLRFIGKARPAAMSFGCAMTAPPRLFTVSGDSLSAQGGENITWPVTFAARAAAQIGATVAPHGVGGSTFNTWHTLYEEFSNNLNPSDAIAALGTNDVYLGQTLAQIKSDADILIDHFNARRRYIWTIPPGGFDATKEGRRTDYNAWLIGGGIPGAIVIDSAQVLADPEDETILNPLYQRVGDPVHPNDAGHVVLGNAIADIVFGELPE